MNAGRVLSVFPARNSRRTEMKLDKSKIKAGVIMTGGNVECDHETVSKEMRTMHMRAEMEAQAAMQRARASASPGIKLAKDFSAPRSMI
jgi:hypothetical protein